VEHGSLLDGLAHLMRAKLLVVALCAVAGLAAVLALRPHGTRVARAVAVSPAYGRRAAPNPPIQLRSTDDAKAMLSRASIRGSVGLTDADIAATKPIYRFGDGAGNFAAGLSAYRTPLANGGFCVSFAAAVGCTRVPPSAAEPLIGLGFDPDAERGGEPFVLISLSAPDVRSVTYTCAGTTYPATMSGSLVAFVAPTSSLRADDCRENVTLASGKVVSKPV
jgi:hypothetical protein